ncbi:MAG TPA: hypothetical protein VGL13_07070 [Polyangiaceae bacterium]|jgi:hypothetical protein
MAPRVVFAPILHGSLPFAIAVREIFTREKPDCVAVELPETLSVPVERAVRRLPLLSVIRYDITEGPAFLLVEPCDGIFEALRLAREHDLPWHLVDRDCDDYPPRHDALPDVHAIDRIGYDAYCRAVGAALGAESASPVDDLREQTMAFHLERLLERHERVLFVCGLAHVERVRKRLEKPSVRPLGRTKRPQVKVMHLHEHSSREVLSEPGHLQALFEASRTTPDPALGDRYRLMRDLLIAARDRMEREDGERLPARPLRVALQFARNLALSRGGLAPDLYELTIAARGVASDDFAWHFWDLGVAYPHQTAAPDLPVYRLTLDELHQGARRLWFRRRLKTRRHALRLVRPRKKEPAPGAWGDPLHEPSICSYPPEDVRIEAYGDYLKKRGKGLLAAERARVTPLVAGFGEGIDLRETIKNWMHDGRLYIREEQSVPGDVGAVCIVFDAEDRQDRYSFTVTWQGEHEEESDMALYATPPNANLVGPKIGRCEYGGFLMTYPPGRMFQVFEDPYFAVAENKGERLLYAAIDYCDERSIVYVAARPPARKIMSLAARAKKQIVYLPIGQLSPATLRKIRVFHVLEGRAVRRYAAEYVGHTS